MIHLVVDHKRQLGEPSEMISRKVSLHAAPAKAWFSFAAQPALYNILPVHKPLHSYTTSQHQNVLTLVSCPFSGSLLSHYRNRSIKTPISTSASGSSCLCVFRLHVSCGCNSHPRGCFDRVCRSPSHVIVFSKHRRHQSSLHRPIQVSMCVLSFQLQAFLEAAQLLL